MNTVKCFIDPILINGLFNNFYLSLKNKLLLNFVVATSLALCVLFSSIFFIFALILCRYACVFVFIYPV